MAKRLEPSAMCNTLVMRDLENVVRDPALREDTCRAPHIPERAIARHWREIVIETLQYKYGF